jgi:molecular chaperone DnaK (HSP70)
MIPSMTKIIPSYRSLVKCPGKTSPKIDSNALLKEDEKQIAMLKGKKAELEKKGGNTAIIQSYIKLAEEMKELNNERQGLCDATESFAKAVGIFSEKIKGNIQKVNKVLADNVEAVIKIAELQSLYSKNDGKN